jgi:CBS domain containing-hemolysin-like protein
MVLPDLLHELEVRDIMISPAITVSSDVTVKKALNILVEEEEPVAIVTDDRNEYIGYIDVFTLLKQMLNRRGRSKVRRFIKRPLPVVKANKKVIDIMRMFTSRQISMIAVIYKGRIMGYITTREMIRILPEIIDSMMTTTQFEEKPFFKTKVSLMGYCDRCGAWSDRLVEVDGNYYCPDCIADLFGESI